MTVPETIEDLPQFTKFRARFNPKRTDDLKPGFANCIGMVAVWTKGWLIEEGENQYAGQWACMPMEHGGWFPFSPSHAADCSILEIGDVVEPTTWVNSGDLDLVKVL